MWPFNQSEHRAANVGDALVDALLTRAEGATTADPMATAAVAMCALAISRPFALAKTTTAAISGPQLEDAVRSLGLTGNAVYIIERRGRRLDAKARSLL